MAELKTKKNNASVSAFINSVANEQRKKDAKELLTLFKSVTKEKPKMWGSSIIGFGQYHYKSTRSSQEGDWMLSAFSPRKQNLSLYIMSGFSKHKDLLKKLGKHKISSGCCLYINKLEDVDLKVLRQIIKNDFQYMKKKHKT